MLPASWSNTARVHEILPMHKSLAAPESPFPHLRTGDEQRQYLQTQATAQFQGLLSCASSAGAAEDRCVTPDISGAKDSRLAIKRVPIKSPLTLSARSRATSSGSEQINASTRLDAFEQSKLGAPRLARRRSQAAHHSSLPGSVPCPHRSCNWTPEMVSRSCRLAFDNVASHLRAPIQSM
jgi:hypothetical protein